MSKQRKRKILKAEEYSEKLGDLIEREFFPDLLRSRQSEEKGKSEIIDLTDSCVDEFHERNLSSDDAAFRASQSIDHRRHTAMWKKVATPGESSQIALRLHPPSQVPNSASSRPRVRRENTRLVEGNTELMEAKIQGTLSAKSVIQESTRRADRMIETGNFDDNHYTLPPVDLREQIAVKLEQDILRGGLRRK
jgi:hypothetical protein